MKRKIIIIFISIIVIALSSCSLFQSEIDTVNDLLPRDSDVPGWVRNDTALYYKGKDVKKYNREYNGLGIDKLASCIYQSIDDPQVQIKLEVIKFSSVLNAYGFYSIKRGPGIFEASQKNEYYSNEIAVIQMGEYAIYSETDKAELLLKKDLKTFVNIPTIYIGQNFMKDKLPPGLNVIKGFEGFGVLYSKKPYHQFRYISKINFTQWSWNGELVNLFFSEYDSFYDAYEVFKKSTEIDYIMISSDNTYAAFKKEQDGTYSFISVNDKWISGCWSVPEFEEGKKILNEIQSRIEDYKRKGN